MAASLMAIGAALGVPRWRPTCCLAALARPLQFKASMGGDDGEDDDELDLEDDGDDVLSGRSGCER